MVSTTGFVGATVETLLNFRSVSVRGSNTGEAANEFLSALSPIGDPFDVPWKLSQSLTVLDTWLPDSMTTRLLNPGNTRPTNHLEASVLALAREVGVCLEPLTKADMVRLQHGARQATRHDGWGRQSPHPWDTLISADIESMGFFALRVPADLCVVAA